MSMRGDPTVKGTVSVLGELPGFVITTFQTPAAAPVSRQSSSDRQTVVRLSAEEREMASMMKMTPEEYGKEKLKLKREGKIH